MNETTTTATGTTTASNALLKFPDILQLFDVSGLLILRCVDDQSIPQLLQTLLSPLLASLNGGVQMYQQNIRQSRHNNSISNEVGNSGDSGNIDDDACHYFSRVIQAVGFTTKTFPPNLSMNVREMYRLVLESSLKILSVYPTHSILRSQIIFLYHRMVSCLNKHLIPYLPITLPPLIQTLNSNNAVETFQLGKGFSNYLKHFLCYKI